MAGGGITMQNRVSKFGNQINNHQTVLICGAMMLTLPAPDFQNHERAQYSRVNRRTRGGDLMIFRESYWPKSRTFSMQWSHLTAEQRETLRIFVMTNLGKVMTLFDHENRSFQVIITTPENEVREDKRDAHTATLDFETTD